MCIKDDIVDKRNTMEMRLDHSHVLVRIFFSHVLLRNFMCSLQVAMFFYLSTDEFVLLFHWAIL